LYDVIPITSLVVGSVEILNVADFRLVSTRESDRSSVSLEFDMSDCQCTANSQQDGLES